MFPAPVATTMFNHKTNALLLSIAGFFAVLLGEIFLARPLAFSFVLGGAVVMLMAFVYAMRRGHAQ